MTDQNKKATPASAKAITPIKEKQTKNQLLQAIADKAQMDPAVVQTVLQALEEVLQGHLHRDGSGEVILHDLGIKIRRAVRPAKLARKGRNPSTGAEIIIPAKPAGHTVRISALRKMKDWVES